MTADEIYEQGVKSFDKAIKWLKWVVLIVVAVFIYSVFIRGVANNDACNTIAKNNNITITFLDEQEERSIIRMKRDPIPGYSIKEIEESYHPFIENLEEGVC
jgi:hypothetical protein